MLQSRRIAKWRLMATKSAKGSNGRNWKATYDLPKELDFRKLRVIGVGIESLRQHAAKRKTVELEPDVAKDFPTAKAVNDALRQLKEIRRVMRSKAASRKSA